MGSTVANAELKDAADILAHFREACKGKCSFIFGADACSETKRVLAPYNHDPGYFRDLVANGMWGANKAMGCQFFNLEDWEVRVWFNQKSRMIRCSHVAKRYLNLDVTTHFFFFGQGAEINQLLSKKWSHEQIVSWLSSVVLHLRTLG